LNQRAGRDFRPVFCFFLLESLTVRCFWHNYSDLKNSTENKVKPMFKDVFDFGKKRTGKEAVQFVVFHGVLVLAVMAGLSLLGVS